MTYTLLSDGYCIVCAFRERGGRGTRPLATMRCYNLLQVTFNYFNNSIHYVYVSVCIASLDACRAGAVQGDTSLRRSVRPSTPKVQTPRTFPLPPPCADRWTMPTRPPHKAHTTDGTRKWPGARTPVSRGRRAPARRPAPQATPLERNQYLALAPIASSLVGGERALPGAR